MTSPSKPELAGGCCVCDAWADDMLIVDRYEAKICRPCTARLGRFLRTASDLFLTEHFLAIAGPKTAAAGAPKVPRGDRAHEELFEEFKRWLEPQMPGKAVASMDLAIALEEIGSISYAVCAAAQALDESVPRSSASSALNWLFAPERAWPGAFRTIVLSMKGLL